MVDDVGNVPPSGTSRKDRRRIVGERPESYRRRQRLAVSIISILLLIVIGIVVAGYVIIFVLPPKQLVIRVNDVSYNRGDMIKLLRLRQATIEGVGQTFNSSDDIFKALQLIVENEIISQSAARYGLSVTREEVTNRIRSIMAPTEDETLGKSDAQVEREFAERHRQYLNTTQVDEQEHRQLVRGALLREKLRQFLGDQVPTMSEQVYVHRLVINAQDEVDIMMTKLRDLVIDDKSPQNLRTAFKVIAREFSRDTETQQSGGALGWIPRGVDEDYEDVFFDLEISELSKPVPNIDNPHELYFFMVSDRAGASLINERNRDILKTGVLQNWLNEERSNHDVHAVFNSEIYNWMLKQLKITSSITPTPATGPSIPGIP